MTYFVDDCDETLSYVIRDADRTLSLLRRVIFPSLSSATEDRLWLTLKVEIYAPVSVVNEALETIVLF